MRILVLGHRGLLGHNFVETVSKLNLCEVIVYKYDLTNFQSLMNIYSTYDFDYVINFAGRTRGSTYRSNYSADDLFKNNFEVFLNVFKLSTMFNVKTIHFSSSLSCKSSVASSYNEILYEPNLINDGYILSKSIQNKYTNKFNINLVLPNVFGLAPDFNRDHLQVIPSLIKRFNECIISNLNSFHAYGSCQDVRQFILADDVVQYIIDLIFNEGHCFISNLISSENIYNMFDLHKIIAKVVGFNGSINFDKSVTPGPNYCILKGADISASNFFYNLETVNSNYLR